ncbi:MAG: regulatory iron-sulfur-containing complex subunit RicT [Thermomicrobiales bacterium]
MAESGSGGALSAAWNPPASLDEARAMARERFRTRLQAGDPVGGCGCHEDDEVRGPDGSTSPAVCVAGVRFRDSGRVYYFRASEDDGIAVGDWVIAPTARGDEAGRVVISPHQVRANMLQGELGGIRRVMTPDDIARMDAYRRGGAEAVRLFGIRARSRRIGIKPISAEYSFDGSTAYLAYSIPERDHAPDTEVLRDLANDLADELQCRVEMRQVGPRDEARLLGGLGRCGRTLCCSSWLPVFPEISMNMAKTQDLPLNPSKVSGVCGRLLCCLSYENEQYRQMKAVMPRLGQPIDTPGGPGVVISLHLLKELVTVRLDDEAGEATFRNDELGLGAPPAPAAMQRPEPAPVAVLAPAEPEPVVPDAPLTMEEVLEAIVPAPAAEGTEPKRRRRRRGSRKGPSKSS